MAERTVRLVADRDGLVAEVLVDGAVVGRAAHLHDAAITVAAVIDEALVSAGGGPVGEVTVRAAPGLVALDAHGAPVHPPLVGADPSTDPDAGWLRSHLPDGAAPGSASMLAKLSWLHRTDPDAWARMELAATPQAWLVPALTGTATTDIDDAVATGCWSRASGEYLWGHLGVVDRDRDWSPAVPRVVDARLLGEWRGVPVRATAPA